MNYFKQARDLLNDFKGDSYLYGNGILKDVGKIAASIGRRAVIIYTEFPGVEDYVKTIRDSVDQAGVQLVAEIEGASPNAPIEDLDRITEELGRANPEIIISFGGGSTIDAAKAAEVLRTLGGSIEEYFGVGLVTKKLQESGKTLMPHIAIQTAASSGAHLTKYSNITDISTGQKKLIVDEAIVPTHPVFDYAVTHNAPLALTVDGGLDGVAHILEVFYGAIGKPYYDKLSEITEAGISLVIEHLPKIKYNPKDTEAREALCLATDLGGYAIMLGGTNGAHLTSFSMVDILSHGRACALMNPYYTVFFAPEIEGPLQVVGKIFKNEGYITSDIAGLKGRDLGIAVAKGMFAFAGKIDFPTTLSEVDGFTQGHIDRALAAAKDPQLKMKLENMPIPFTAGMIDEYMGPILEAARSGDLSIIKNV